MKSLVVIPVYNEEQYLEGLTDRLREVYLGGILFVDDGSRDCSPSILQAMVGPGIRTTRHCPNRGYGAALITGFNDAIKSGYDSVVTMDSDGQHKPAWIPEFLEALSDADVVSGSRYLAEEAGNNTAPIERQSINKEITSLLNSFTGFNLTDAFCGFKAYRTDALAKLALDERGYAMPLQFWVQAKVSGLTVKELPVSRIYVDPNRKFGNGLDDAAVRLKHYRETIEKERARWKI